MKKRIAWFLTDWHANEYREKNNLYGAIGYYRVVSPAKVLSKWFDIDVIGGDFRSWGTTDETFTRLGREYDLIISKPMVDDLTASNILATANHYKRKVIVDLDDNHLALRADNKAIEDYGVGKKGGSVMSAFIGLADGLIVSTDPLKKAYSQINKKIDVLPNCNNYKEWGLPKVWNDGIVRIGYMGGLGHDLDLDLIVQPIGRILAKYPNVHFEVIGALSVDKAREMGAGMLKFGPASILERFKIKGGLTEAWEGYPEKFAEQGWDIGLAPLIDDTFNQCKSHIKWYDYSMIGAATVASPVHPYIYPIKGTKVIEHGKSGFLASNPEKWVEYLELLIENEDLRKGMAVNAYLSIKKNWQQEKWASKWKKVIEKYL